MRKKAKPMKQIIPLVLALVFLAGCGTKTISDPTSDSVPSGELPTVSSGILTAADAQPLPYVSRFDGETSIILSDSGISVDGGAETDVVRTSNDIVYYEDRDSYDSGNPYGEGTDIDKHTADEAAAHTVVNITAPGAYRISGKLSRGQIRVDLGENACDDAQAVVELILDNADITCSVAPAIVFRNVYECDGNRDADNAVSRVDTSNAGAVLVLEGENAVSGSYVAKIFQDKEGEKKLWKQDGAIYSYMSMNVEGSGKLDLTAQNEGLDTEMHLTINGGQINIRSGNDGINTNEDGVSVTTINAGFLHIIAGLGEEGDGIDSNGYLVINGGVVVSSANSAADAGLDSDLGSYINGGTVIALGSTMDWAESDSDQVTMNLQFADYQSGGSAVAVTREDGTVLFAYDPSEDEVLGENIRRFMGAVVSCPNFQVGERYHVYLDGSVSGTEDGGIYDVTSIAGHAGGIQMMYSGTDVGRGVHGDFGGGHPGGPMPEEFDGEMPTMPEGETIPEGFGGRGDRGRMPEGERPEDFTMPADFGGERPELSDGETLPEDFDPGRFGQGDGGMNSNLFYMNDKVNAFSGLTAAE